MSENLELKSISEILEYDFFIPSYQRGYRWDTRQVEDLLEDILEFSKRKERNLLKPKEFYCLQPIVVKYDEKEKYYRVIDGQQRLTTIYIILKYLESKIRDDYYINKFYHIKYETRNKNSSDKESSDIEEFLNTIDKTSNDINDINIDFHYISKSFQTIKNWFIFNKVNKGDFLNILLKSDIITKNNKKIDLANNIRIIWYEIENDDEIKVFTRLNIGKIPLTNSELIKALLLLDKTKSKMNEKIILATQWDSIEYKLQDNTFFAFINGEVNKYKKPTRIEFIFDLIASNVKLKIDNLTHNDEKYSYYIFDRLLNKEEDFQNEFNIKKSEYDKRVEFLWDKVKTYFRIFEELYKDNIYYHFVGYLVNNDKNIDNIINIFNVKEKDGFLQYLQKEIAKVIQVKTNEELFKLEYGKKSHEDIIKKNLFLFNIISTMKSGYVKYPFYLHKKESWSLEHIHAQNSDSIKKDEDKRVLLRDQKKYIEDTILQKKIDILINSKNIEEDTFNKIQEKIFNLYADDINIHTIDNMALLSRADNSALNNSIFPSKRDRIRELDAKGSFIPIGTKNVFLKYYSDNVKEAIMWGENDRKKYREALQQTLKDFYND